MSFFDDASLVFLPSGEAGKDGKAYSMKPTNGNGDFTFSRGSNLTATRVDSNGLIEKGRENLLLQSNQFDTTWTLGAGLTLTSGQTGYDGSSDAWVYSDTSTGNSLGQTRSTSGVQTLSIYAKAGTTYGIRLRWLGGSGGNSYFNIADSSTEAYNTTNTIQTKKESIGNGWFRISIVFNSAVNTIRLYVADGSTTSSTSGSIYIQDAQLEQGLVATEYIESGATTGLAGILEDSPRFDYSGGASCPSLLLEPSRTSLYQYSEYIFNFQGTNTFNAANSPEGVSNAVLLTKTSASDQFVNMSWSGSSLSPSTDYTMSLFVKYNGYDVDVRYEYNNFNDWGKGWNALFQVRSSGVTASTTASCTSDVKDYGNGWYRIIVNVTTASSITPTASSNLVRIIGASADEVLIYGAGMEQGSYPTSYIPNHSGGSVTRNADDCGGAGTSSTFNDTEGVLFIELDTSKNASPAQIAINDGTYDNRIIFEVRPDAAFIKALINSRGTNVYDVSVSASPSTAYKVAIKYSANDIAFFVNGVKETSTTTTTAMPTGLSDLSFTGKENDGALRFIGNVKQTLVFNTALSDNQCIALTS